MSDTLTIIVDASSQTTQLSAFVPETAGKPRFSSPHRFLIIMRSNGPSQSPHRIVATHT